MSQLTSRTGPGREPGAPAYDNLNRVTQAYTSGTNWGETFTIDGWGNLTNKGPVSGKTNYENFNAAPATIKNQLNGYCHDAAGNLVLNAACPQGTFTPTYSFDIENRLAGTAGFTYAYDGDGKRVKKCSNTGCTSGTLYWMGTGNDALQESDFAGNATEDYVFFDGKRVARRDASGGAVHYYVADHLGSTAVVTSNVGGIQKETDYFPYGGEIVITGSDINNYKFTGKERDSGSGLDNVGARYYASTMGRFMTPDWAAKPTSVPYAMFGDPQTLNLYGYVRNNPLAKADPDGHCAEAISCGIEFGAGGSFFGPVGTGIGVAVGASVGLYLEYKGLQALNNYIHKSDNTATANPSRPGTLGKPDHQETAEQERIRTNGNREVPIATPGGNKEGRRADVVGTNPTTGKPEIVQVYRPTPAGNVPKREKEAAQDIQDATGIEPTMVPVRPLPQPSESTDQQPSEQETKEPK